MDLHSFTVNLQHTIAWCLPKVDINNPKYCLRSEDLRPKVTFDTEPDSDVNLWAKPRMVEHLMQRRAELLSLSKPILPAQGDLTGGRLLLHFLDVSNFNGLSAEETSYFLDDNDTPPWDSWVQVCTDEDWNFIVSWVPAEFLTMVQRGIEVEAVDMLMWADTPYEPTYASIPLWLKTFGAG